MKQHVDRYFRDVWKKRLELREAINILHEDGMSDEKIQNALRTDWEANLIPRYPKRSVSAVSRITIRRIRIADDEGLARIRSSTCGTIYNFLCHSKDLETPLLGLAARVQSSHELAPLLDSLQMHMGAMEGPLTNAKLKTSLEGTFHLYRRAWTSPESGSYIRSILKFEWMGDALFYTETQKFTDTIDNIPVDEIEKGIVFPFGLNVVLLGRATNKDMLKFYSVDNFSTFPDGQLPVHNFSGNFIAIYGKGEHPGYRAYAKRIRKDQEISSKFYAPGKLPKTILKHLAGDKNAEIPINPKKR